MPSELWRSVDDYFSRLLLDPDPVLDSALEANRAGALPSIDVSPQQGKLLHLLACSIGACRILEVGTLGGYSTIWLARALPPDGRLITCEIDRHRAEVATSNIAMAGLADIVDLRVGAADQTLSTLDAAVDGPFDLTFIDADKGSGTEYFEHALRLSRPGSLIIVDNVVRGGRVVDAATTEPTAVGSRRLAEAVAREKRVSATVIQTVGAKGYDGFLLARVE
ncbi:O-methyltransferase [Pseudonocardia alaniniphila]|uniref:O-methyltransferase n=1 Tax=Pseudonocardia alaniniphila TaxID=75291 RepID=A0ABS9TNU3_9PSEU|nr:O-methyltransferase [Pseudonocardia alaniniphila]MCH6170214.1 O-methyltransferase [Pseudonocardia alaniniphila]